MTREKAIKKLKNFADHAYPNEEFLMAIKALKQEPCKGGRVMATINLTKDELKLMRDITCYTLYNVIPEEDIQLQIKTNNLLTKLNKYYEEENDDR